MNWTEEPAEPGLYLVMFRGNLTAAQLEPSCHEDGSPNIYRVNLIGSDDCFRVAKITAWCRIPDPPPLPAELQQSV